MSLYCCWISKLSKSVGDIVLMVSRQEENTFNLQSRNRKTKASAVSDSRKKTLNNSTSFTTLTLWFLSELMFERFKHFIPYFNRRKAMHTTYSFPAAGQFSFMRVICKWNIDSATVRVSDIKFKIGSTTASKPVSRPVMHLSAEAAPATQVYPELWWQDSRNLWCLVLCMCKHNKAKPTKTDNQNYCT